MVRTLLVDRPRGVVHRGGDQSPLVVALGLADRDTPTPREVLNVGEIDRPIQNRRDPRSRRPELSPVYTPSK